jgi:hypothetical protein
MTRAEIKTSVQALGYGTDTDTAQNEAINSTIRRIEGFKRWPWQEVESTAITLAIAAKTLAGVPADLLHVDAVRLVNGTTKYEPIFRSPQEVRRLLHNDTDNGTPRYWTKYAGSIYIYPRGDAAYTGTLDYIKDPTDLTADGSSPILPATYHDCVKWGVVAQLAFRERDWAAAGQAEKMYALSFAEMNAAIGLRERQNATHITRSSHWSQISGRG